MEREQALAPDKEESGLSDHLLSLDRPNKKGRNQGPWEGIPEKVALGRDLGWIVRG